VKEFLQSGVFSAVILTVAATGKCAQAFRPQTPPPLVTLLVKSILQLGG